MRVWVLLAAVAITACVTATGGGGPANRPVGETERVELRMSERYIDPTGGLEIQPIFIEVDRATLAVRVEGLVRTVELTTGPMGSETVPPYSFELVSTTMAPSATVLVTRIR